VYPFVQPREDLVEFDSRAIWWAVEGYPAGSGLLWHLETLEKVLVSRISGSFVVSWFLDDVSGIGHVHATEGQQPW
jgi:hypothetical protein